MVVEQELALLTDDEAERCLNGVIKTYVSGSGNPALQELVASPDALQKALEQAGATGSALAATSTAEAQDIYKTRKAIRTALVQAATDPALLPRLEAYLTTKRDVLFEPVTTALVLAGIVFLLSTKFNVHYEEVEGKKQVKVDVSKDATTESVLSKFFAIFK